MALAFTLGCSIIIGQQSSLCTGSLGDNIFEDGDFGSDTANIGFVNPSTGIIAPDYIYTDDPPPYDGYFVITNNSAPWARRYNWRWIDVQDNSPDPFGYMMLINADYEPGVFYQATIDDLCENTTYEFAADIINIQISGTNIILPVVSFFLDGELMYTTGQIPENERWETYGFTFTTPPGVTEMTLSLRNDAAGGIGNDLAIDNISFRACGPRSFINTDPHIVLCKNNNDPHPLIADIDESYMIQWQLSRDGGATWENIPGAVEQTYHHEDFTVGEYMYRYLSASSLQNLGNIKCRHISDEVLVEVLSQEFWIDLGPDLDLDFGELSNTITIQSTLDIAELSWTPDLYVDFVGVDRFVVKGIQDVTYVAVAESYEGCQFVDSLVVRVGDDAVRIYIPNTFSPNGDGINDLFGINPYGATVTQIRSLVILDRWGGVLYSASNLDSDDPRAFWDGSANGNECMPGVYTYYLEVEIIDGSFRRVAGDITLVR